MNLLKKIALDIAGIFLILVAIFFGWLPGIGGIPLFLAGLGLLAINHKWARNFLERIKKDSITILQKFFSNHPLIMAIYDIAAISLFVGAIIVFAQSTSNWLHFLAWTLGFIGVGIFLGNRRRIQKINAYVKKKKP